MHPLSPKFLGPDGLSCIFANSDGVTSNGYFTKQLGTNKFVATNGSITQIVKLAQSATQVANLTALPAGLCTIMCITPSGTTETIRYISAARCVTIEGNVHSWRLGDATDQQAGIQVATHQPDQYSWLFAAVL